MKKSILLFFFIFSLNIFSQDDIKIIEDLIIKNDIEKALSIMNEKSISGKNERDYIYIYVWAYFMQGKYSESLDYIKKLGTKVKDDIFYKALVIANYIYYKTNMNRNAKKIYDYILNSDSPLEYKLPVVLIDKFFNKKEKRLNIDFIIDYLVRDYTSTLEQKIICKPLEDIENEWKKIEKEKKELEVLKLLLDEKKRILELKEKYLKERENINKNKDLNKNEKTR